MISEKVDILIFDKRSLINEDRNPYKDLIRLEEVSNCSLFRKYYRCTHSFENVRHIWYVIHNFDNLENEIIKYNSVRNDFFEGLPDLLKENTLLIAGHWGDLNSKEEYRDYISQINTNQIQNSKNCFISYFGSKLLDEKDNFNSIGEVIEEIIELAGIDILTNLETVNHYYQTQKYALEQYLKEFELNNTESKKIADIKEFIKLVDDLEKLQKKISQSL